jgi:hypothetical protein
MPRWAPPELVSRAIGGDRVAVEDLVTAVWRGCFRLAATVRAHQIKEILQGG